MKKNNKMKPEPKKGVPILWILFIVGFLGVLGFQNLADTKTAEVSFSHQLEHLINLDLIDTKENKKLSLNDNLVTFSGTFKDHLGETARERYRYLNLLNQHYAILQEKQKTNDELTSLKEKSMAASSYFLALSGIKIGPSGYTIVSDTSEVPNPLYAIVVQDVPILPLTITSLKKDKETIVKELEKNKALDPVVVACFGTNLSKLIDIYRGDRIGIGSEGPKKSLRDLQSKVSKALDETTYTVQQRYDILTASLKELEEFTSEMARDVNGVRLADLRSVLNYVEYLAIYKGIETDYKKNGLQLDKARQKVANVVWFVDNQEFSTRSLEKINPEVYQQWFIGAEREWQNFAQNKGLVFKAPDQPRTPVLDKTFKSEEPTVNYFSYLFTFLPLIIVALLLWFVFSRQMKGVGSSAMNFGKSPAKLINKSSQKVTFEDVAGIDDAKEELEEIVEFLRDTSRFTALGAKIPKGVLLIGAPGTGKTLIAKAVAGEAGVPFFSISGSDFVEMFVGVGASRVRDLFEQARKNAPCIIFIDEIDAVGRHRGSGLGGGHDEREQTLNQLLVDIDGMDPTEGVILIAATNRPDVLDKALLRPGRFDRSVYVELPEIKGRLAIAKVHSKAIKMADDVNLKDLAQRTAGCSGADIANIINEAAIFAARKRRKAVMQEDLKYAHEKVTFGKERKSLQMEEDDKKATAYHETGHALVALTLNTADKVDKVTCTPRARSLGATHFVPKAQRVSFKKQELKDQLAVLMGGRIGEEVYNKGDASSGAQMDIRQATQIARSMVCEWGMSDKIGMINYADNGEKNMMAGFQEKGYSEETAILIDTEIKNLLDEAYTRAKTILNENMEKLHLIAAMLIEFETLEREDLDQILNDTFNPDEKRSKLEIFAGINHKEPPPIPTSLLKKFKAKKPELA
jgi:cell division protease FtsH